MGDIDERMAALLKDHQEMGARPKEEPESGDDAYEPTLPLTRKGSSKTVAQEVAEEKAKARKQTAAERRAAKEAEGK